MLMSIPVIVAASLLAFIELIATGDNVVLREATIVAIFSFIAALAAVAAMMAMLKFFSFTPFVIYRIILGIVLLIIAL